MKGKDPLKNIFLFFAIVSPMIFLLLASTFEVPQTDGLKIWLQATGAVELFIWFWTVLEYEPKWETTKKV